TTYPLRKTNEREHIIEGLIKAISILDELIHNIRESKNKADAKANIIATYHISDQQSEAILALQLYRLTNIDINHIIAEKLTIQIQITKYEAILASQKRLHQTIKNDLRQIKKTYASERLTDIEEEIEDIKINIEVTVPQETCIVSVTKEGYIKRTSLRSYSASNKEDLMMKSTDNLVRLIELDTTDHVLLFTNFGKYVCIPVHELSDIRW